ncbi:hypothetical protein LTR85_008170 [Meristemomyces frigidus]|nr:hypothetical protein LTR85_008170 [Meristemomyces frigidus]
MQEMPVAYHPVPEDNHPNKAEVIDDDDEFVLLEHSGLTAKAGEELNKARSAYKEIFDRQAKAMCGILKRHAKHKRHLQDIAHAVGSAGRRYMLDRHGNEWRDAVAKSKKLLEEEYDRAKAILEEDMPRADEDAIFRGILSKRKARLVALLRDEKLRDALCKDLRDL